jgi:hypothetical protein
MAALLKLRNFQFRIGDFLALRFFLKAAAMPRRKICPEPVD